MLFKNIGPLDKKKKKKLPPGEDPGERKKSDSPSPLLEDSFEQIHFKPDWRSKDDPCIIELLEIISRQEQIMINLCSAKKQGTSAEDINTMHKEEIHKINQKFAKVKQSLDLTISQNLTQSVNQLAQLKLDSVLQTSEFQEEKKQHLPNIGKIFKEKRPKFFREDSGINKLAGAFELQICKHFVSREKLKCYVIEKSNGRIVYPYNDRKFKLIQCPIGLCRGFVTLKDIKQVFSDEELKEVEEYNQPYIRKSFPDSANPQCVICSFQKLSMFGCPKHPMCPECEQANREKCKQCPAYGCLWESKD